MTSLRPPVGLVAAVLAASLLAFGGCGSETGADAAADPDDATSSTPDASAPAPPSASASDLPLAARPTVPVPSGPVTTRWLSTVIADAQRSGPELCLGPVAESYPPQCRGLPLGGWDWSALGGAFESQGRTRWGSFAVTGTFDGTTVTVTSAIPAALYDAVQQPDTPVPAPATTYSETELQAMASDLMALVPGVLNASADPTRVLVDVVYDDGSIQRWADDTYGAGVVAVTSALVSVG